MIIMTLPFKTKMGKDSFPSMIMNLWNSLLQGAAETELLILYFGEIKSYG